MTSPCSCEEEKNGHPPVGALTRTQNSRSSARPAGGLIQRQKFSAKKEMVAFGGGWLADGSRSISRQKLYRAIPRLRRQAWLIALRVLRRLYADAMLSASPYLAKQVQKRWGHSRTGEE